MIKRLIGSVLGASLLVFTGFGVASAEEGHIPLRSPDRCPTSAAEAAEMIGGDPSGWGAVSEGFHYQSSTRVRFDIPPNATVWRPTQYHTLDFPGEYFEGSYFILACFPDNGAEQIESPPGRCDEVGPKKAHERFGGDYFGWSIPANWYIGAKSPAPMFYQGGKIEFIVPQRAFAEVDGIRYFPGQRVSSTHVIITCYGKQLTGGVG